MPTNCGDFCASHGLVCDDANDERGNSCRVRGRTSGEYTCATSIGMLAGWDAICYCSNPQTPSPSSRPTRTPTRLPTPTVTDVCIPSAWPAVKNGEICKNLAECSALIDFAGVEMNGVTTCNAFCAREGLSCVDADDEKKNRCTRRKKTAAATTCLTVIDASLGSDAICYCGVATTVAATDQRHQVGIASVAAGQEATPGSSDTDLALQVTGISVIAAVAVILVALGAKRRAHTAAAAYTVPAVYDAVAGMIPRDTFLESAASSSSSSSPASIRPAEAANVLQLMQWDDVLALETSSA